MSSNFENLIESLLQRYECVILPDFGGFIVRESPCNFSASGDRIKPYSKHIFFNPHLTLNDGLVYNEIQTALGYTYNDAINWYKDNIARYKQLIADAGSAHFGHLGTFFQGKENNFWFSPSGDLNLAKSTYGLYPVDIRKVVKHESAEIKEPVKIVELISKAGADKKPIETTEPARLNYKAWAAAAVVALLVHFTYLKLEKTDVTTNEASVLPTFPSKKETPVIETPVAQDTVEYISADTVSPVLEQTPEVMEQVNQNSSETTPVKTEDNTAETSIQAPTVDNSVTTPSVQEQKQEHEYTRVARYRLESNALFHRHDLEKKGKVVKIELINGLYEVSIEQ